MSIFLDVLVEQYSVAGSADGVFCWPVGSR